MCKTYAFCWCNNGENVTKAHWDVGWYRINKSKHNSFYLKKQT